MEIKTQTLCSITLFEKRAVYEIMWKNTVEWGRTQMTTWRKPVACWITKVTHKICNTAFPLQQWLHECVSLLRFSILPCIVLIFTTKGDESAYGCKHWIRRRQIFAWERLFWCFQLTLTTAMSFFRESFLLYISWTTFSSTLYLVPPLHR